MNQPNFRKHLTLLAFWAKACKDHLEYQAKHGKAPPSPDEARADIFKAAGFEVAPLPNPYFKLLAKWKKTGKASPFNFVFDHSSDPFYQLFDVAQRVCSFLQDRWPGGVADSKAINDLWAMLRPIVDLGGRSATIPDLKRIAELVESILGGKALEAKEPLDSSVWLCPKGSIGVPPLLKAPLHDYLTGETEHKVEENTCPYKIKSALKKLIQKAKKLGFDPPPKRWPKGTKLEGGAGMVYFNGEEDGNTRNQGKRKKA